MADKEYRANWQIQGLTKKDLFEGDKVTLSEDAAAELVKIGALTLAGQKPVVVELAQGEPASAVASDVDASVTLAQSASSD
jgi:hypothetical protein